MQNEKSEPEDNAATTEANNQLININHFLKSWMEIIPDSFSIKNKNIKELIQSEMQLSDSAIEDLAESCSTSALSPVNQVKNVKSTDDLKDSGLSSIDFVVGNYGLTTKNTQALDIKLMRHMSKLSKAPLVESSENMINLPDVVLTVQISQSLSAKAKKKFSWSEEFFVLGQNYLTSLKDKIMCFRSGTVIGEFSSNATAVEHSPKLQDVIKSGYLYIENTFYNDTRDGSVDCSQEFLKWAKERGIGKIEAKPMEQTKFSDLSIKLAYPYLFTHLGDCEHLLLFVNIRLINPSTDSYDIKQYPILKNRNRGRLVHCWLCDLIYAKWIIRGSEFVVDDPCLLCDRCFKNTHYDDAGKKLCNFEAYHFPQLI